MSLGAVIQLATTVIREICFVLVVIVLFFSMMKLQMFIGLIWWDPHVQMATTSGQETDNSKRGPGPWSYSPHLWLL